MHNDESEKYKDGRYLTARGKEILAGAAILICMLFVLGVPQNTIWRSKTPGSFFERAQYSTKLYVLAYEKEASTKSLKLEANVSRGYECSDSDDETVCSHNQYYRLNSIKIPDNGGTTEFDECFLNLNKRVECTTTDEETLYFQLTNESVK